VTPYTSEKGDKGIPEKAKASKFIVGVNKKTLNTTSREDTAFKLVKRKEK
jgi:hypothetical protein